MEEVWMSAQLADSRVDGSFDDLVGDIYGIGTDAGRWGPLLQRLCQELRAELALVATYMLAAGRGRLLHSANVGPDQARSFSDLYALPAQWVRSSHADPLLVEAVAARAEAPDGDFYARWLDPSRTVSFLQALITHEPVRSSTGPEVTFIALARSRAAGEFTAAEIARVNALVSHIRRALDIHATVAALKAQWQAAMDSFDKLGVGVVILDGDQRPLGMNQYARELVASRGSKPLETLAPIMFNGEQGAVAMRACGLLGAADDALNDNGFERGAVVETRESNIVRPIIATSRRLDNTPRAGGRSAPASVIFLSDPERKGTFDAETMRRLYGLTRAEANIAVLLAEGRHLDQAADELDISINTARTHLKRVLEKTSTTRQADLVRLLLNPCTQIRA
jgi:DNA-binding CsgD family transcriptional regulator/PAS domain-containing protein